ncbi:hypothetical protein L873DRAFT_1799020 [Choiromyces venosus 120613-1]|uniref:Uncharacterized protein n=1 Tax=Choiromyces venosus 120613-1 TaxID=1336337 RepID=A0A3N4K5K6_9PEZI|nr:hypothetical protein L873DRAFT_1799020 [Choiromyces venosus 120613-1]
MKTIKALLRSDSSQMPVLGSAVSGASTLFGTGAITRTGVLDNLGGHNLDIKIDGVEADISHFEKKLENCHSMIMENGHHTMHALDWNTKSMREWL